MELLFAILIGTAFGFILQKAGAANPQRIIDMLRLKDFHLMKAIFLGIGSSSLLLFALLALGWVDSSHVSVKTAYSGVILGGAIMGIGWAVSGFCPGTGLVAAGARRKDALFFTLGGLAGALLFTLIYGSIKSSALFEKIGEGKITLAETGIESYTALLPSVPGVAVAGGIGIVFILIAWKLPKGSPSE
ncbi:DUF6691 family protein [Pontiella sulfatireligans]|uniref:Uncharacterized protein n=1 Tax=Pontiella sulfatireligans TaxID=2750658 RepID=A0A6C2UPQ4_9BACT|nr:DUF6691 family protein [Pontiella sulfatireligans]VGO22272.1 hypothetical protein SCARR_04354 [Pontiella sulfatireligans]